MRLIDADALMNKLGIEKECAICEQNSEPYCKWNPDVVDVCEAICTAPTVTADIDTINRQAAIDAILAQSNIDSVRGLYEYTQEYPTAKWEKGLLDAIDAVIDIDEVPSEQQRWIPCSEQLPEDGTWNIFSDGENISVERYKMDAIDHFFPQGRWFSFDKAIAWMPLPEPYHNT